ARKRIVFPEGTDERTLEAVARLQRQELVFPIVLGPPDKIRMALADLGADADAVEVADPFRDPRRDELAGLLHQLCAERGMTRAEADERVTDPLYFGALLVRRGDADGGVAGAVHATADVLRAALRCIGTAPGIRRVSSSFYMVVPPFRGPDEEVLTFTDAGVNPDPDAPTLADIARAAVADRRRIV